MLAVHDRARHRPLDGESWSPERVRAAIRDIVAGFEDALRPDGSWPTHPFEAERRVPRWRQYDGAAGAVSALRILCRGGYDAPDLAQLLPGIHAHYLCARRTRSGRRGSSSARSAFSRPPSRSGSPATRTSHGSPTA